jgi:hypothetical protein
MSLKSTVLFGLPQSEIASLIKDRITLSSEVSIVTGFATPGGLAAISGPLKAQPLKLKTLVVGAATYPGFEALDNLLAVGVPLDRLHVHLGHTTGTGGRKNPFARYHPMLHSKVYYMVSSDGNACAFIGSHNVTAFALTGLNGEAAVLLEGPIASPEFDKVRQHIDIARSQSVPYAPAMKEAYAWWTREFVDGMRAEVQIPQDWMTVRTILLFANASATDRPKIGENLYFEIPAGIEQIESLKTETHLFLFGTLPTTPSQALELAMSSDARYVCITLGAENKQGNREVEAQWRIDGSRRPVLTRVPSATYRPSTSRGMQQVRAEIKQPSVLSLEYLFERETVAWDPQLSSDETLHVPDGMGEDATTAEALHVDSKRSWKLVRGLLPRRGSALERDATALKLATPESGSFVLVSLRRRRREQ